MSKAAYKKLNQVRINSGQLRGRTISFSSARVRPTKATVRKTLFNWLRPHIQEKTCLDCFSGSAILAFEAISEGAKFVFCTDSDQKVIRDIQNNIQRLSINTIRASQIAYPHNEPFPCQFDIVFCDPPFEDIPIDECLQWLVDRGCMRDGCFVYVEYEKTLELAKNSAFDCIKTATSAGVGFSLLVYRAI